MVLRISRIAIVVLQASSFGACVRPGDEPVTVAKTESELPTGPERIEWDQAALEGTDVASYRFVLRMDGVETELTATCGELLQSGNHLCSADLPPLTSGRHVLTVAAIREKDGKRFESRPSLSLTIDGP